MSELVGYSFGMSGPTTLLPGCARFGRRVPVRLPPGMSRLPTEPGNFRCFSDTIAAKPRLCFIDSRLLRIATTEGRGEAMKFRAARARPGVGPNGRGAAAR
jgi:hypothetical protein